MPHVDPEARRAYHRDYKRSNRWRYSPRQKAYDAAKHANERAIRFGAPGVLTPEDVEAALSSSRCHHCGTVGTVEIDHLVPMSRGGENTPANVVPSCDSCNSSKGDGHRPWRWSRRADRCARCGTSDRRHLAREMCSACYQQTRSSEGKG